MSSTRRRCRKMSPCAGKPGIKLVIVLLLGALCFQTGSRFGFASSNWQTEFQRGTELLRQKNFPEARQCFQRVTELQPSYAEGFFYLAISALHTGDRPAAETAFREAVKLNPAAVSALYNLGVLLLDERKPAEAADYLERARQVDPNNQELTVNLIRAELESREEKRALSLVDSASRQFAGEVGFHAVVGKLLLSSWPQFSCLHATVGREPPDARSARDSHSHGDGLSGCGRLANRA